MYRKRTMFDPYDPYDGKAEKHLPSPFTTMLLLTATIIVLGFISMTAISTVHDLQLTITEISQQQENPQFVELEREIRGESN